MRSFSDMRTMTRAMGLALLAPGPRCDVRSVYCWQAAFVAAFAAQSSYGDAARLIMLRWYPQLPSTPFLPQEKLEISTQASPSAVQVVRTGAPPAQPTSQDTVPPAATLPELAQMLQSVSHDLANLQQSTEQMKTSQEQNAHDIARVSEQVAAAQAQMARENANAAEQLRMLQQRMAHLTTAPSEQNLRPKASAPTPIAPSKPKPLPALPSPQARAQPLAPTELRPGQQ